MFIHHRGQALVEFCIVASGAIGFLMIFLPLLGKVGDVRYKTIQGARYSAWERTVYYDKAAWKHGAGAEKTEELLREEANKSISAQSTNQIGVMYGKDLPIDSFLFFSNRNKLITSSYETFLRDQKNLKSGLPSYLSYRESNLEAPSVGPEFSGKVLQAINMPYLPNNGLYRAYSMMETKPLHWWKEFDQTIAPEEVNVILADGWSVGTGNALQAKMKEGAFTKANNESIKILNDLAPLVSLVCVGIFVKCGRDFEKDRLSETSALPMYVPDQRLEK